MNEFLQTERTKIEEKSDLQGGLVIRCHGFKELNGGSGGIGEKEVETWMQQNHFKIKKSRIVSSDVIHLTFLRKIEAEMFQQMPYVKYQVWKSWILLLYTSRGPTKKSGKNITLCVKLGGLSAKFGV